MNDLIFLTLEPVEGGHEVPWDQLRTLIDGYERALQELTRNINILDLEISKVALTLVGSPVVGSLRFQFKLDVKAEFKRPGPRRSHIPTEGAKDFKRLAQDVGVNSLGGVIAASIMLAFAGPSEEPSYGPESRLAELCASQLMTAARGPLDEMKLVAEQANCRSVRMQYQSFPPLELAGQMNPLSIKREITDTPPSRLELFLRTPNPVVVYLNGEKRIAYFVSRLDNQTEALAIFARPIPKVHLNDRLLTQARRLKPAERRRLFISPPSLEGPDGVGVEERMKSVRSVLEITANHGVMGNRPKD